MQKIDGGFRRRVTGKERRGGVSSCNTYMEGMSGVNWLGEGMTGAELEYGKRMCVCVYSSSTNQPQPPSQHHPPEPGNQHDATTVYATLRCWPPPVYATLHKELVASRVHRSPHGADLPCTPPSTRSWSPPVYAVLHTVLISSRVSRPPHGGGRVPTYTQL